MWPARPAAWGRAGGVAVADRRGAGTAAPGSAAGGPGPPEETASGQQRCGLATAEARGAPGPGARGGGAGTSEAGAGGVVAGAGRASGTAGVARRLGPGLGGRFPRGGGPWGRPSPPPVAKGVHALGAQPPVTTLLASSPGGAGCQGGPRETGRAKFGIGDTPGPGRAAAERRLSIVTVFLALGPKWSRGSFK